MNKRLPILLGFLLLALALWLRVTHVGFVHHLISRFETLAYDIELRTRLLTPKRAPFQTSIAIVDINDQSLRQEGRWPWPRSKLATLVDHIRAQGAVVIVFDMIFPTQEDNIADIVFKQLAQQNLMTPQMEPLLKKITPYFDNDSKFAASLAQGDSVVGVSFLLQPRIEGVLPLPLLKLTTAGEKDLDFYMMPGVIGVNPQLGNAAKNVGFIDVFPDEDGIIRRVPLLLNYHDGLYPSLALEAVRIYLLKTVKLETGSYGDNIRLEGVRLGEEVIPTDERGQVIIPFRGRGYTFPFFSAADVLHNKIPSGVFSGKIVFVGSTAVGLGDLKPTAIQSVFPGLEVNATIADGILKNDFPRRPAWALGMEIFLIFFIGVMLIFLFPYLGPKTLTLFIFILPIMLIMGNNWLYEKMGLVIPLVIPMMLFILLALLNIIYGYLFETRRRERLKEMFGQYVPEKHIDEMLKSSTSYGLHGEDREMTVLFADIRHFTTLSEGMSASQLKNMLNDFFTPMTEIIFKHHGTIDKYVGDLIMAFWGAPLKDQDHVMHALNAALDMQQEMIRLKSFLAGKWPEINIGIGINSGLMSVGDMGSKFRLNYTVLGDAVNLASRVESLTKEYGVGILVTEFIQANQNKFVFRLLDRVRVKGKSKSVALYELICRQSELTETLSKEIELGNAALNLYFQQQWSQAREAFEMLHKMYPSVKCYSLYLKRLAEFSQNPPPSNWDGVYTHTTK
ncbi:MAG: cyaA 1 [Gammaproteobacteria bacterium]|jgi:adenylate cyclase|nr:cyaA 1 [Gammaproteobacteria bacterium]